MNKRKQGKVYCGNVFALQTKAFQVYDTGKNAIKMLACDQFALS